MKNVCKYHKNQFVNEFSNNYRRCEDPLKIHKTSVKTSLHEITLEEFRLYCTPFNLLPGQKLCFRCKNKLFTEKNETEYKETEGESEEMETDEISHETATDIANQSLIALECSPLKVPRSDRALSLGKKKINEATEKI